MPVAEITTRAVSLMESGVLVNGTTVTDLLSGLTVRLDSDLAPGLMGSSEAASEATADSAPLMWRGSSVPLARLEAIRELIAEVIDTRAQDPELMSPNPRIPRTHFPWGVGEKLTDVVVTGSDARLVAAYLRSVGVRARCADSDGALRIAADLEIARAELAELEEKRVDVDLPVAETFRSRRGAALIVIAAIVASVVAVSAIVGRSEKNPATTDHLAESEQISIPSGVSTTENPMPPWQAPQLRGSATDGSDPKAARAENPVNSGAKEWTFYEATKRREIWVSEDSGVRILVAATPTPLMSQEELDSKVLAALGNGLTMKVSSVAPIDYEEQNPGSVTRWQIRLIDSHQVSVGCQYRLGSRDIVNQRLASCDRFIATARVG